MILITGAKGFIGSSLLSFLRNKGYDVEGIDEDIGDIERLRPYFKHAEFIIHLAAKTSDTDTGRGSNDMFKVNVGGTMNVIGLCIEYGCKLINTSSISTTSKYGISKTVAEELVRLYAKYQGLHAVTIRPCIIYDENSAERHSFISRHYPLGKLIQDIENIIIHYNFKKYKVYTTGGLGQKLYFRELVLLKRKIKQAFYFITRKVLH